MYRRIGTKGIALWLGALAGCGLLMMRLASSPSHALLAAAKLSPIKNPLVGSDVVYRHPPGDQEVLVGRTVFVPRDGPQPARGFSMKRFIHAARRNVISGQETALPALDPYFARDYMALYTTSFSPDGRWLLCGLASPGAPSGYTVCRPDGTQFQRWQRPGAAEQIVQPPVYANARVQWLPDSQRWIEFREIYNVSRLRIGQTLTIHDVRNPDSVQTIPIAPSSPLFTQSYNFERDCKVLSPTRLLMAVEQTVPGGAQDERQSVILELNPAAGGTLLRTISVPLPPHIVSYALSTKWRFSPSGKQILWVITQRKVDTISQLLHRLRPAYTLEHALYAAIWVGRTDGAPLHEIGSLNMLDPEITVARPVCQIMDAGWMPNEKQLWFSCADSRNKCTTFYSMPAD